MARKLRLESEEGLYHVINRGNQAFVACERQPENLGHLADPLPVTNFFWP